MAPQHGSNGASSADVCARTEGGAAGGTAADAADEIPVLDLSEPDPSVLASQIYRACSTWGFFQLINHGISAELVSSFRARTADLFALDYATKAKLKRDARNARGYFDDELTKRRRDWKEALDVGAPGSRDWGLPDGDGANACLDGFNRFPTEVECPGFRDVVVEYFEECAKLSDRLAALMARALGNGGDEEGPLLDRMRSEHTSYLRMNYYPPGVGRDGSDGSDNNLHNNTFSDAAAGEGALGISPHRDAGFLTVLLQDDDCHSLQVARFEDDDHLGDDERWVSVRPMPGALTINTGDMAMICSNGRFRAPLHRVLTDPTRKRYSAPFFYNPGYGERMAPFRCSRDGPGEGGADAMRPKYNPCVWGYFRALRFAGDLTDLGVEIQTSHFKVGSESSHIEKQRRFMEVVDFGEPFDVEKYRHILETDK
ncbi:hypothetical protein ACHAWF_012461 [Thalassiosira exigua]